MRILYFIPARGGSKRFPGKNLALFRDVPLFLHSVNHARMMTTDDNICLSTDSEEIKEIAEKNGLEVPVLRPTDLATDECSVRGAILYSLYNYKDYDAVMVLQPTSPLREVDDMRTAIAIYLEEIHDNGNCDAVFSSNDGINPNGVVYLINLDSLRETEFKYMGSVVSFPTKYDLDINYPEDINEEK